MKEEDGSTFNLDCDLNVPTVPCGTPYDRGVTEIQQYLYSERPVIWIEESSKLELMRNAANNALNQGQNDWPIKFRMINRDKVLPRHTIKKIDGSLDEPPVLSGLLSRYI